MSADWYDLGLELKVRVGTLDSIRADFTATKHQLREMLKAWLNTGDYPSWKTLINALRSPMVGASQMAAALETKYCPVEGTELDVGGHSETVFPFLLYIMLFSPNTHVTIQTTASTCPSILVAINSCSLQDRDNILMLVSCPHLTFHYLIKYSHFF